MGNLIISIILDCAVHVTVGLQTGPVPIPARHLFTPLRAAGSRQQATGNWALDLNAEAGRG